MTALYIDEYRRVLVGREVLIACREGILRDHFDHIVADVKFLDRQGVRTVLLHNLSNRFANRQHFAALAARLPGTRIVRVPAEADFYHWVLNHQPSIYKLIFLERKFLIDPRGHKINALTTQLARQRYDELRQGIANLNFKSVIEAVCRKIEEGRIDRVHILPAGRQTIKRELFSVEGSGTLIANNFAETFEPVDTDEDVRQVATILKHHLRQGYLKPRSMAYLRRNRNRFHVARIDGIVVGCAEQIELDARTVELGALAISTKFRNQRVGVFLIRAFAAAMAARGYHRLVSLTGNPKLARLYTSLGFDAETPPDLAERTARSRGVTMYVKRL